MEANLSNSIEQNSKAEYIAKRLQCKGGLCEAVEGLRHKTLPFLFDASRSITIYSVAALLVRVFVFAAIALFPILVKKAIGEPVKISANAEVSFVEGLRYIYSLLLHFSSTDMALALLALILAVSAKILGILSRKDFFAPHMPYGDLSAAIRESPKFVEHLPSEGSLPIRHALNGLRDEMAHLANKGSSSHLTDVTLLVFDEEHGSRMKVAARTAPEKERATINRPIDSEKLMAFHVAVWGRAFAEHDFLRKNNPFPPTRLTVSGNQPVDYRSILFLPVMCAKEERVQSSTGQVRVTISDYCVGVVCIHCSKPYRFWRWGDHKRTSGVFAEVAYHRAMPYIALIERLLEPHAIQVMLRNK